MQHTAGELAQMLKGSVMFFSAIFSVLFLDRKLVVFHWTGLFLCVLGLACVGFSSVLATQPIKMPEYTAIEGMNATKIAAERVAAEVERTNNTIYGILSILVGQVICAIQYVVEEFLLKPPNFVKSTLCFRTRSMCASVHASVHTY